MLKDRAILLRSKGRSLQEIASKLHVSKSTASLWVRHVSLNDKAKARLLKRMKKGQANSHQARKKKSEEMRDKRMMLAQIEYNQIHSNRNEKNLLRFYTMLLWWCEGNTDTSMVQFTNSDSKLVKCFMYAFRNGFVLEESKFRVLVHLHSYHSDLKQKKYWSRVTGIPIKQFYKSYMKKNTGRRKKENYEGCVAISYYDANIAKELDALYTIFTENFI